MMSAQITSEIARTGWAISKPGPFHLTAFLANAAEQSPEQTLTVDGMEFTYEQAWMRVLRIATWLQQNGVSRGDRVLTVLRHSPDLHLITLAVAHVGAVISVLSPQMRGEEFEAILEESGASCIFLERTSRHLKKHASDILTVWLDDGLNSGGWEEADFSEVMNTRPAWGMRFPGTSEDPAFLVYSSGAAKGGVLLSHDRVRSLITQGKVDDSDGILSLFDSALRESHHEAEVFAALAEGI